MTSTPSNANILVIDDNEANRYALTRMLKTAGFEVHCAEDGMTGLALTAQLRPDLVVLDIRLPDISGLEVCARLKADPVLCRTPVLHVSASYVQPADQARGLESGADGYLVEPVDPAVLLATVRALLRARQAESEARRTAALAADRLAEIEAIYHSAPVGMCVLDRELRYRRINARLAEINGPSAEAHLGRTAREVVPDLTEQAEAVLRKILETGDAVRSIEFVGTTPAQPGVRRTWIENWLPLKDADGNVTGINVVAQEITERKQMEEELRRLNSELARSNAELEQFAAIVSHDLRSPLTSLDGSIQLLCESMADFSDDQRELLGYARDGTRQMSALISSLLDYSRLGKGGLKGAPCDCQAIVSDVVRRLKKVIESTRARITFDALPTVPGDCVLLAQLFQNLIENAIKYRGDAPPEISVCATPCGDEWRFAVRDNGLGIEPRHFERVFQIFQRLHADGAQYGGLGVGLATCKKITEKHGGRIWLESQPGRGSTFFFSIPSSAPPPAGFPV